MKRFVFLLIILLAVAFFSSRPALATCSCQNDDYSWETLADSDALTTEAECRGACTTEEGKDYIDGTTAGLATEEEEAYERSKEVKARALDFVKNDLCQCYCGKDGEGAQAVGESGFEDSTACKDECTATGKQYVGCATSAEQAPLANPVCWSEEDCESDGGLWDTDNQPYQCAPSRHYCYPTPEPVSLNVDIGGLDKVSDIGTYINALYAYGLGAGALIAIVLIMIGGAQYILGSGIGSVDEGKKRIINAVTGLVILLGAYLLLATVNPYLVSWKTLEIPKIKPMAFLSGSSCNDYDDLGYIVDPTGKSTEVYCGNEGLVTSTPEGVEMTQECVYAKCTQKGEFCMQNNDAYECISCDSTITAASKGLTITSGLCASFPATTSGDVTTECLFVDAASKLAEAVNLKTDFCAQVELNCATLTDCTQYQHVNFLVKGQTVATRMYPDAVERLCTQNLCEVPNGCVYNEADAKLSVLSYNEAHPACVNASGESASE